MSKKKNKKNKKKNKNKYSYSLHKAKKKTQKQKNHIAVQSSNVLNPFISKIDSINKYEFTSFTKESLETVDKLKQIINELYQSPKLEPINKCNYIQHEEKIQERKAIEKHKEIHIETGTIKTDRYHKETYDLPELKNPIFDNADKYVTYEKDDNTKEYPENDSTNDKQEKNNKFFKDVSNTSIRKNLPQNQNKKEYVLIILCLMIVFSMFFIVKAISDSVEAKINNAFYITTNISNCKYSVSKSQNVKELEWFDLRNSVKIEGKNYKQYSYILDEYGNYIFLGKNSETKFLIYGDTSISLFRDETHAIKYYLKTNITNTFKFISSNPDIATVSEDGIIKAVGNGEATIFVQIGKEKFGCAQVEAKSLLVKRPKEFDETKQFVQCGQISDADNVFLDKKLQEAIDTVGYKTRAGVVEALRFITLDFAYRIDYFNENGRLPDVDGEGRYYHKGLYLSESKYQTLINPKAKNRGTWGCTIYSYPAEESQQNGLDCSSLITWAMYNAGYDPGDERGAELLQDLGTVLKTKKAVQSKKIKVGDLVHNNESGSHIGIIIGKDDDYYYVAQAIWYEPNGVCISKYTEKQFISHWKKVILLDEYYKDDGKLTKMWY